MNDQLLSLQRIFTDRLFRIPDYQRGYAWGKKEIEEYWNDLIRLPEDKNHYVGVLTLEPVPLSDYRKWIDDIWLIDSKSYRPYYIVDGQQRLTTSILLIVAFVEVMIDNRYDKLNYSTVHQIKSRYILDSKDENCSCSFFFSYDCDNPSYDYLTKGVYLNNKSDLDIGKETIYTTNLDYAKSFFISKLKEMDFIQLENTFKKLTQHFLFNTYEISSNIDVYVTFETMNNRGKPLSYLELLKNRLIYISTLFDVKEDVKARLRRDINQCWKTVYHLLGVNKDRKLDDDEFLTAHFRLNFDKGDKDDTKESYFYYRTPAQYLLNKYFLPQNISENKLSVEQVFGYINSLNKTIHNWSIMNNPELSSFNDDTKEYLKKIYYLCIEDKFIHSYRTPYRGSIRILLLAILENNIRQEVLLKFLQTLEKYLFLVMFIPEDCYSNELLPEINFQDMLPKVKSGDLSVLGIREKLSKAIEIIISSSEINKKIISYYNKRGFYGNTMLRYFLCEYEVSLMKMSKNLSEKLNRDILFIDDRNSIEHIYPQNARNKYWTSMFSSYTQKQKTSLRDSLGNFVAISPQKNSKLGNLSFIDKKGNQQNSVGYMYGTYAEIELCKYENWGSPEILDRGFHLVEFLQKRWDLKIGKNKDDIKEFLGVQFL